MATIQPARGGTAPLPKTHAQITWWLAAGLVGADIGTSVFYSTGILFPHVGFAAPFFILLVVGAMWLFKATYQEGTAVAPINGGAYTMLLQTVGRRSGLVVGSLTILSYLATAVVSALSGAYYLSSLWQHAPWPTWQVAAVAAIPVVFFAFLNLFGLKESTKLVFGIAAFHFLLLIVIDFWGLFVVFTQGADWSRLSQGVMHLGPHEAMLGLAAAFLGITGFETAAQIVEELEAPSWKAIQKIYLAIVLLVSFTAPISSMLCMLLLDDAQLKTYSANMLSGLAFSLGGKPLLYVLVVDACLTLFAAVNTAYAGATGLMTTMGKQGNLPPIVLHQWTKRVRAFQGYPYVALPFMAICLLMLMALPGSVNELGEVYGMAFLAVMVSYCLGVVLLRLYQPHKIARSPYLSKWVACFRGKTVPMAAVAGGSLLLFSELVLLLTAKSARDLGVQLFLIVLLVMVFYRLGQVEGRMVRLPDLRIGLGKFRDMEELPENLPVYVLCTSGATPARLVTTISYLLKIHGPDPVEIVLFHAEEKGMTHGVVSEALQRVVSQQLEDFFSERDFILSVKVLPGNLAEVLPEYKKVKRIDLVYITSGRIPARSEDMRQLLANELGLDVIRLDEASLPKGPGAWFNQWVQSFRKQKD
ncbi:APC family permease [bacterium]|nr:APC family permease [bacterium]